MPSSTYIAFVSTVLVLAFVGTAVPTTAQETAREGIHVQGDWVIEVHNPDGSLADRREFSNDLVGPRVLAWALSAEGAAGIDAILLTNCIEDGGVAVPCYVDVTNNQTTLLEVEGGVSPVSLVLEGSTVASLPTLGTTTVTDVASIGAICEQAGNACEISASDPLQPGASLGATLVPVTSTTLGSPVEIADGQTVSVTVTISFN